MRCRVMGIVNVTPDSFSDGGRFYSPEEAIRRARNLIADGADMIDLGGESTRPGATPVGWEEEWRRVQPVLEALEREKDGRGGEDRVLISVDTYHPETAQRAIEGGADIVNCVREESVPAMLRLLEFHSRVELVLPSAFPVSLCASLVARVYRDPMIGFGTTREEDLVRLRSIPELAKEGRVLVGASRKRIVKKLTGERLTGKNLGGNLGIAIWAAMKGASVVRVHDVKETVQALRVIDRLDTHAPAI